MKKNIYFLVIFAIIGMLPVKSQVRIGSLDDPNPSAVLDLNPDDRIGEGNSSLGLALPRVNLRSTRDAFPLASHVQGMTVYNVTTREDVVPGVYFNDGRRWFRQADSEAIERFEEKDGVVGNEVTNATTGGGLIRSGSGTATSPYTLGISAGGVSGTHLANDAVTSAKIANGAVTTADLADAAITTEKIAYGVVKPNTINIDGDRDLVWMEREDEDNYFKTYTNVTGSLIADNTITNAKINPSAGITLNKLSAVNATVGNSGASQGAVLTWDTGGWQPKMPASSGIRSVSGANGITVTNGTTTPTISLPAAATSGEVLKWNGSAWAANTDNNTTYAAGNGLSLTGNTFEIKNAAVTADHLAADALSTLSKKSYTMRTGTVGSSSWFETTSTNQMYEPGGIYVIHVEFELSAATAATLYVQINSARIMTIENPISSPYRKFEYIYINDTPSKYKQTISFYLKTVSGSVTVNSGKIDLYRIGKL
jgi:hypothetical protein